MTICFQVRVRDGIMTHTEFINIIRMSKMQPEVGVFSVSRKEKRAYIRTIFNLTWKFP